ncbi:ABC transporter ATP-binding protein [Fusobacterium sp. PH5-44]|uniref:ABC transporter ATP-binding protein n=1 Tax=unclassified Fusobacterium TaxID=2648384 RepID=UPI003D1F5E33
MAKVVLKNVQKHYPNGFKAVCGMNLNVEDGEFIVFVGPSGCGKTTTLRMIAGLEEITDGEIYIGETLINNVLPKDRKISMVFQNYTLYPHMTVYENMAFSLKLKKISRDEIHKKICSVAERLEISNLLDRKPKDMSGGQRQRVALGKAIVKSPEVFLFDEPLSNLDAKLRVSMRTQISQLHKELGTTVIYVTHDQVEAMTMGDRICVLKDGKIMQVDTPLNLYNYPDNKFVAGFIGSPMMNFIDGLIIKSNEKYLIKIRDLTMEFPKNKYEIVKYLEGKEITLGIRPEHISIGESNDLNTVDVAINMKELMGNEEIIYFNLNDVQMIARLELDEENTLKLGKMSSIILKFDMSKCHLFDIETEERIYDK